MFLTLACTSRLGLRLLRSKCACITSPHHVKQLRTTQPPGRQSWNCRSGEKANISPLPEPVLTQFSSWGRHVPALTFVPARRRKCKRGEGAHHGLASGKYMKGGHKHNPERRKRQLNPKMDQDDHLQKQGVRAPERPKPCTRQPHIWFCKNKEPSFRPQLQD